MKFYIVLLLSVFVLVSYCWTSLSQFTAFDRKCVIEQKRIGIGLVGFGISFTFLGVILFFDRGLIALGNLFSLSGVSSFTWLAIYLETLHKQTELQGTFRKFHCSILLLVLYLSFLSFIVGLFLLFVRWPISGIVLEIYGVIVLFSDFWPSVKAFFYNIPIVGWFLQYPFLLLDRLRRSFS